MLGVAANVWVVQAKYNGFLWEAMVRMWMERGNECKILVLDCCSIPPSKNENWDCWGSFWGPLSSGSRTAGTDYFLEVFLQGVLTHKISFCFFFSFLEILEVGRRRGKPPSTTFCRWEDWDLGKGMN